MVSGLPKRGRSAGREAGFTLLELLIVMVIIATLAAIAIPAYTRNVRAAKEAVLKADLHVMRNAIDSYTVDKAKAPQSLNDLVESGYLKGDAGGPDDAAERYMGAFAERQPEQHRPDGWRDRRCAIRGRRCPARMAAPTVPGSVPVMMLGDRLHRKGNASRDQEC